MRDQPTNKTISISPRAHRQLKHLCAMDRTLIGGQVELLIEQELERRGVDPKTLKPATRELQVNR